MKSEAEIRDEIDRLDAEYRCECDTTKNKHTIEDIVGRVKALKWVLR